MPRTAVKTVDIPTIDDMDQGMSTPAGGWRLYSARDDWFKFEYGSIPYYIPPDKDGMLDDHPVKDEEDGEPSQVVCDGTLNVDDRVGRLYRVSATGGPTSIPTNQRKVYESSRDIVRFAVKTYGDRGITFLTGDPRSDAIRKKQAKDQYLLAQIAADEYQLQTWDAHIKAWKQRPMNANQPLPAPPEAIRMATERRDARDAQRRGLARKFKHTCTLCGSYATDDDGKFSIHQAVNHGIGEINSRDAVAPPEIVAGAAQANRAKVKGQRTGARA